MKTDERKRRAVPAEENGARKIAGLTIQKVNEHLDFAKILIYGEQGVGKSRLAASACKVSVMSPVLLIDIEGGTKSIRKVFPKVDVIRVMDVRDKKGRLRESAWDKLWQVHEGLWRGDLPYKTVIVDSLSEAAKLSMVAILTRQFEEDPDRHDPEVAQQRDWGKANEQVRKFVRQFRDLPMHVIFTALAGEKKDSEGNVVGVGPDFSGQLRAHVPSFLDEVFYMYAKSRKRGEEVIVTRSIQTQPARNRTAKDRSDAMPFIMEDPTMTKIAELILD